MLFRTLKDLKEVLPLIHPAALPVAYACEGVTGLPFLM
jgi:hypothetical protein